MQTPVLLIMGMMGMMPRVRLLPVLLLLAVLLLVKVLLRLLAVLLLVKVLLQLLPVKVLLQLLPVLLLAIGLALLLMVLPGLAYAVPVVGAGAVAPAPAALPCHAPWPENVGSRAGSANAEPPADRLDSNNVPAGTLARTAVHILSKDTNVRHAACGLAPPLAEVRFLLAVHNTIYENDLGPREPFTPDDQVSERSVNFVPRRFVQPLITAFPLRLLYPIPRSSARALARATARFWPPERALLTRWPSRADICLEQNPGTFDFPNGCLATLDQG